MDAKARKQTETLKQWIGECSPGGLVFLGGAGVSTESGIPDFRSVDGLYSQKYDYPPETIISHDFFMKRTKDFYDFYFDKMIYQGAQPNAAHIRLAELEQQGILSAVITQNIDGLHQAAGSRNVLELHGSVLRNNCMRCQRFYDLDGLLEARERSTDGVPRCDCGHSASVIKPDVVLYQEQLDEQVLMASVTAIAKAEMLIIAGTSLSVWPAAGLMDYYKGDRLVIINLAPTDRDRYANLCIAAKVGEVLEATR